MKKINSSGLIFLMLLMTACNNDNKKSATDTKETTRPGSTGVKPDPNTGGNLITFTANGEEVISPVLNIGVFDPGNGAGMSINITSNMNEQPKAVNFNINGNKPGTYTIESGLNAVKTPGKAYGSYNPDYKKYMTDAYSFESGEFVIVSIDDATSLLNATFHGVAKNSKDQTITITDGKVINGKLRR